MLSISPYDLHTGTFQNSLTFNEWLENTLIRATKVRLKLVKFFVYFVLATLMLILSPVLYLITLYLLRDIRNKVSAINLQIPAMSIDELQDLQDSLNTMMKELNLNQVIQELNQGSAITFLLRASLLRFFTTLKEISDNARAQQVKDIELFTIALEDNSESGIILHELDTSDW